MAAFVLRLLGDTKLVADSIQAYVWGLRWKMKLEHQADPVLGVMHWQEFMRSVRVKSHVRLTPTGTTGRRVGRHSTMMTTGMGATTRSGSRPGKRTRRATWTTSAM